VRSSLTGVDIFNAVMLQRSLDKRLVILVESPEDCGIIDPHVNNSDVQTFPGYGKESVLMAAQMFLNGQIGEVIAVIDADLDRYTGRQQQHPPNVVMTEFYDLDADMLVHCPQVVDAVAANFSDKARREAYLASRGISVNEAIWEMATAVGEVRYCSVIRLCGLNLREFPLHVILDEYEQGAVQAGVLALALARTPNAAQITTSDVAAEVASLPDKRYVTSGHDLASALSALTRKRWGGAVGDKMLASTLRSSAAAQCQWWKKTAVYKFVQEWARQFSVNAWTCL
jgi:hypothetical protein